MKLLLCLTVTLATFLMSLGAQSMWQMTGDFTRWGADPVPFPLWFTSLCSGGYARISPLLLSKSVTFKVWRKLRK